MKSEVERFFDAKYYALSGEAKKRGMRPFDHYIKIGEALGYAPSALFDPKHYALAYEDVASFAGGLLSHYVRFGRAEGRSPLPDPGGLPASSRKLRKSLPTILIVVHEASRTGAPVLAWNLITALRSDFNVVTLLLNGGPIEAALEDASSVLIRLPSDRTKDSTSQLLCKVVGAFGPRFAIANSVATRDVAIGLEDVNVPVIALVHEFSNDFQPVGTLHGLFLKASKIVFPAQVVAAASLRDYIVLRTREYLTLPQGLTKLPNLPVSGHGADSRSNLANIESIDRDEFVVVGMGTVTFRKGVDVFISVAASLLGMLPRRKWKFVWVGHVYPFDAIYKAYLKQQISNSGLDERVLLMDEVADLDPIYRRADALLLSSRLDPLPNVAIDAALRGLPVVSFRGSGGIAEFLDSERKTRGLAVPYLDVSAAAGVIRRLLKDSGYRSATSRSLRRSARSTFRMPRYVAALKKLGQDCVSEQKQAVRDLHTILEAGVFDAKFCFGPDEKEAPAAQSIWRYLKQSRVARPLDRARTGLFFRRPMVGFNPLIYASDRPEMRSSIEDPLAHFLRSGRPAGRWTHQVIVAKERVRQAGSSELRVALHGHFHYPELVSEFLDRVALNETRVDLVLTTTGRDKANEIRQTLKNYGIRDARIEVVENRGRDIGPFLDLLRKHGDEYDVFGHIHGKKSSHVAAVTGDRWREFMLQHLLGGTCSMADAIIEQFADDATLGLVFPEDPHLNDWDENRAIADRLARKMKIKGPLPVHFDFPIGTMFWARPRALKPLLSLNLAARDYPSEPVPIDGTILHALERLLPFSAEKAGYRYATSHVPGSLR